MQLCVNELYSCEKRARPFFFSLGFFWGFSVGLGWIFIYGALVLFHGVFFQWLPLLVGTYSLMGIIFVHNSF